MKVWIGVERFPGAYVVWLVGEVTLTDFGHDPMEREG